MKRIRILFILVVMFVMSGCNNNNMSKEEKNELQLVCSYELVAAKVENQTQISGELSGNYLFCLGSISGNLETTTKPVYKYWYKREDGGILSGIIDMSSYVYGEKVEVVIYEDDTITPKVEIWKNYYAREKVGGFSDIVIEIRFTIPSGSFVNTYDLQ